MTATSAAVVAAALELGGGSLVLGFGRIVVSEIEAPSMIAIPVQSGRAAVQSDNATEPYLVQALLRRRRLRALGPPPSGHFVELLEPSSAPVAAGFLKAAGRLLGCLTLSFVEKSCFERAAPRASCHAPSWS